MRINGIWRDSVWEDICDPLHHESIEDLMLYHKNHKNHFTRKKMDLANIGEDLFCKKKKVFEPAKSKDVTSKNLGGAPTKT